MSEGGEASARPSSNKLDLSQSPPQSDAILNRASDEDAKTSDIHGKLIAEASGTTVLPSGRIPLDEVLMEALRVPRDRIFILRQEKDIEDKLRCGQEHSWELPLMNSYQRLLVHRIADHFRLAHAIDASTKAVTLSRQPETEIPECTLSSLAMTDMERLSESAYAVSREAGGLAGNLKIMRREGIGRSDSPRNGQVHDENALARDRRNMTIEEREAAYKEARLRIFGNEEASTGGTSETSSVSTPLNEMDTKGLANLSLGVDNGNLLGKGDSRKGTPGRVSPAPSSASSTSSAAFLRAGAPSFDPNSRLPYVDAQWHHSYPYPMIDNNTQPYYYYPAGHGLPMLQHDINGRQMVATNPPMFLSPMYAYPHQEVYSSGGPSPSVSSRSTSIAGELEADGGHSAHSRAGPGDPATQMSGPSRSTGVGRSGSSSSSSGYGSRPQSLSPANSFQRGPPSISHVYQGQIPVPASWNVPPTQSTPGNLQQMGYAAAVMGQARSQLASSSHSSLSSAQSGSGLQKSQAGVSESPISEDNINGYGSRGLPNQSERSLFDPSKPANGSTGAYNHSSSAMRLHPETTVQRQPFAKSVSAGVLDGRPISSDSRLTLPLNANLPTLNSNLTRRVSSSSASNVSSADVSRRGTPPSHPSLPARPDWVLQQRGRVSQLSNSSAGESNSAADSTPA